MEIQKSKILLFLKLNIDELEVELPNGRDVSNIGHFGTGNYEIALKKVEDVDSVKLYIEESFKNIGG